MSQIIECKGRYGNFWEMEVEITGDLIDIKNPKFISDHMQINGFTAKCMAKVFYKLRKRGEFFYPTEKYFDQNCNLDEKVPVARYGAFVIFDMLIGERFGDIYSAVSGKDIILPGEVYPGHTRVPFSQHRTPIIWDLSKNFLKGVNDEYLLRV